MDDGIDERKSACNWHWGVDSAHRFIARVEQLIDGKWCRKCYYVLTGRDKFSEHGSRKTSATVSSATESELSV
jgi:hypothetical protein